MPKICIFYSTKSPISYPQCSCTTQQNSVPLAYRALLLHTAQSIHLLLYSFQRKLALFAELSRFFFAKQKRRDGTAHLRSTILYFTVFPCHTSLLPLLIRKTRFVLSYTLWQAWRTAIIQRNPLNLINKMRKTKNLSFWKICQIKHWVLIKCLKFSRAG